MRSERFSHSDWYRKTLFRARALNSATPKRSMSFLPLSWSSFSTSISTGRPCVSHPAMRVTCSPRIAW
jgi:hypothetical protein